MTFIPAQQTTTSTPEASTPSAAEKLRSRDAAEFDRLVERETPALRRLVHRLLGWEADVDDVVQEVLIAAWGKIDSYRGDSLVSTWLAGIAIRQCRRAIRRKQLRRKAQEYLRPLGFTANETDAASNLEEKETDDKQRRMIRLAIQKLPQNQREVLVLVYLEANPLAAAATLLGIKKNTAEKRVSRAKEALREMLKNHE